MSANTRQGHCAGSWSRKRVFRLLVALIAGYHFLWLTYTAFVSWQEELAVESLGDGSEFSDERRMWYLMPSFFSPWICTHGIGEATVGRRADLKQLPMLRNVYAVAIPAEPRDRRDIVALRNCPLLIFLELGPWVTDDDLERVAEIPQVKRIFISSPHVTLSGVSSLSRISGLKAVDVISTPLTEEECLKLQAILAPADVLDKWELTKMSDETEEEANDD